MVRRPSSTSISASQDEGSSSRDSHTIKAEKTNSKGKSRRVESDEEEEEVLQQTQHGVYDDDDDDGDEDGFGVGDEPDDAEGEGSPKGRKRARVNTEGDARPSRGDTKGKAKVEPMTLPRDVDGCVYYLKAPCPL